MAHPPAVGDRAAAQHPGLQHREPGGRVHQHVRGRHHVHHALDEAQDPRPPLAGQLALEAGAQRVVAPAQAEHGAHAGHLERGAHRAHQVAHAPSAPGHGDDALGARQAQRAARLLGRRRLEERRVGEAVDGHDPRRRAGDPPHLVPGLRMREQVDVDPAAGPVAQRRQVGDRGHGRHLQAPRPAQPRQPLRHRRMRGDHHVGPALADEALQPPPAHPVHQPLPQRASGRQAGEHQVLEVEDPVHPVQAEGGAHPALAHRGHRPAHGREPVGDLHLGARRPVAQLGGQHARRQLVPFAHPGREDQNPGTPHGSVVVSRPRASRAASTRGTACAVWRQDPGAL